MKKTNEAMKKEAIENQRRLAAQQAQSNPSTRAGQPANINTQAPQTNPQNPSRPQQPQLQPGTNRSPS